VMSEKSCSEAANRTPSVSYPKEQEKTRYSQIIMIYKNHLHHRCLKSDAQNGPRKNLFAIGRTPPNALVQNHNPLYLHNPGKISIRSALAEGYQAAMVWIFPQKYFGDSRRRNSHQFIQLVASQRASSPLASFLAGSLRCSTSLSAFFLFSGLLRRFGFSLHGSKLLLYAHPRRFSCLFTAL